MAGWDACLPGAQWWTLGGSQFIAEQPRSEDFYRLHDGMLIALHAIIKKGQKAPADALSLARERLKDVKL